MFKRWLLANILIFALVLSFAAQIWVLNSKTQQNALGMVYGADGPLAGAMVSAVGRAGFSYAVTDSSGHYTMTTGLVTGTYSVTAFATGYIAGEVDSVSVIAGQTTPDINFALQLSGGISGTVTDALNQSAISGAYIYAELSNGTDTGTVGWFGTTGSDGSYLLDTNLSTGMYNVSILLADGYVTQMTTANVVAGVETKNVNFVLPRSGIISGKVAEPNGTGLPGITVIASSSTGSTTSYGHAITDASGNYRITTGLGADNYTVVAMGDGNYSIYGGSMSPVEVSVTAGQETSGINMELTPVTTPPTPSGTITGRVTDQDGNPIMDAFVSANGSGGFGTSDTDSNGYYNISSGLGPGTDYNVSVSAQGYYNANYPALVTVTVGETTANIDIQMTAQPPQTFGTITGIVTEAPYSITGADIEVQNVSLTEAVVSQGLSFNFNSTVANVGDSTATFNVTAYANQSTIGQVYNVTLTSGNSATVSFAWNTTGFAYGNYTVRVYAWPVPGETNTANNYFTGGVVTVTIPGDLNGDFKVSLQDLQLLANAYGSKPGDSNWNPFADLAAPYGIISLTDLVTLAIHYGQHNP